MPPFTVPIQVSVGYDFAALQATVLAMIQSECERPAHPWTLQGLGMLRLTLTHDRSIRLHVWDDRFAVDDVSEMHTHPWGMRSTIIRGRVDNQRFREVPGANLHFMRQAIFCGEGGGLEGEPEETDLIAYTPERYIDGQTYEQGPEEIHVSSPRRGTVTLVERKFGEDVDHAYVYWPQGQEWVSAEPRAATTDEITQILGGVSW
jgi:hypothetical protein